MRGVSHKNADGTDRQEFIAHCKNGESLTLIAEPKNPYDRHAVAVFNSKNQQLGYLPSDARDSSSLLRDQPISAVVLKRIGGPKWWHGLFGVTKNWGMLIKLSKGNIDWEKHNQYRNKAEPVDKIVKEAVALEKSSQSIDAVIDSYISAMQAVNELNASSPIAAAHRYEQAPINRLTMALVKAKRKEEAVQAYHEWSKITDPIGLTKADSESLKKRVSKLHAI